MIHFPATTVPAHVINIPVFSSFFHLGHWVFDLWAQILKKNVFYVLSVFFKGFCTGRFFSRHLVCNISKNWANLIYSYIDYAPPNFIRAVLFKSLATKHIMIPNTVFICILPKHTEFTPVDYSLLLEHSPLLISMISHHFSFFSYFTDYFSFFLHYCLLFYLT